MDVGWMQLPQQALIPANCPPGLEYLVSLDQILVHQVVELLEAFMGFETDNKYAIKNILGQQCFYAFEESGCCAKQCCGSQRGFVMKIVNNVQTEVIRRRREFNCCTMKCTLMLIISLGALLHAKKYVEVIRIRRDFNCCAMKCCWLPCCGCTQYKLVVEAPPGQILGTIHNSCSFWKPYFKVNLGGDDSGMEEVELATITGPCIMRRGACFCCDVVFDIRSAVNGDLIGRLTKQSAGFIKELYTDADNFSITFPKDLDVRCKALLLSAVFLIDFMYYENNQAKQAEL